MSAGEPNDVAGARWLLLDEAERAAIKAETPEPVGQFAFVQRRADERGLAQDFTEAKAGAAA